MSEKYKKVCNILIYFEHFLIFVTALSVMFEFPHLIHELFKGIKNSGNNCRNSEV